MLKQRVITAVILGVGILLATFLLPDWAWGVLTAAIVTLALWEWCALTQIKQFGFIVLVVVCAGTLMYCGFHPISYEGDGRALVAAGYMLSIGFWLFSAPSFLYFRLEPAGWYWRYALAVLLTVPTGIAMFELRRASPLLFVAALLIVCIADISAFFAGRAFGKHKLAPEISPGKTWEGVIGAVLGVELFCLILWMFVPQIHKTIGLFWLVCLALLYVVVSVLGDLFESLVKREAGEKDSGTLLPGHGGVLDRVDSMLAFFPFAGATLLFAQWMA
jgi:phosphatidate cytidylyltransferase